MVLNLFLIPLLGGYYFITKSTLFKFEALRSTGHHLFFRSAIAGATLGAIAHLTTDLLRPYLPEFYVYYRSHLPFPYLGTAAAALVLGIVCAHASNRLFSIDAAVDRAIETKGDPLEILLKRAMQWSKLVLLTTKGDKAYVGFVTNNFNPAFEIQSVSLIPAVSGYRKEDTREVVFTTDYQDVLNNESALAELGVDAEDFEIAIPLVEIRSVSFFNPDVYRKFFHPPEESNQPLLPIFSSEHYSSPDQ